MNNWERWSNISRITTYTFFLLIAFSSNALSFKYSVQYHENSLIAVPGTNDNRNLEKKRRVLKIWRNEKFAADKHPVDTANDVVLFLTESIELTETVNLAELSFDKVPETAVLETSMLSYYEISHLEPSLHFYYFLFSRMVQAWRRIATNVYHVCTPFIAYSPREMSFGWDYTWYRYVICIVMVWYIVLYTI